MPIDLNQVIQLLQQAGGAPPIGQPGAAPAQPQAGLAPANVQQTMPDVTQYAAMIEQGLRQRLQEQAASLQTPQPLSQVQPQTKMPAVTTLPQNKPFVAGGGKAGVGLATMGQILQDANNIRAANEGMAVQDAAEQRKLEREMGRETAKEQREQASPKYKAEVGALEANAAQSKAAAAYQETHADIMKKEFTMKEQALARAIADKGKAEAMASAKSKADKTLAMNAQQNLMGAIKNAGSDMNKLAMNVVQLTVADPANATKYEKFIADLEKGLKVGVKSDKKSPESLQGASSLMNSLLSLDQNIADNAKSDGTGKYINSPEEQQMRDNIKRMVYGIGEEVGQAYTNIAEKRNAANRPAPPKDLPPNVALTGTYDPAKGYEIKDTKSGKKGWAK